MADRAEATWEIMGAAIAAALGGALAAVLLAGVQDANVRAEMILSSAVSLTAGLYCVCGAKKLLGQRSTGTATTPDAPRRRDLELPGGGGPRAAAAFPGALGVSSMEIRMTDSLKSIRDQAELGLFASDDDKASYLAMIWSMAASDLESEFNQVTH